jgi:hypothetical protein
VGAEFAQDTGVLREVVLRRLDDVDDGELAEAERDRLRRQPVAARARTL